MSTFLSKHWFKLVTVVLLAIIIALIVNQLNKPEITKFTVNQEATDFTLENIDGRQVSLQETDGKVRIVYFFFSFCPDVCPPTTFKLSQVQEILQKKNAFGTKAAFYSVSFDSERDTRERLNEFASYYNPDPESWFFLRGDDEEAMKDLAYQYKIGVQKDKNGNFMHSNVFVLVDKQGNIRHFYLVDDDLTPERIANDILALSNE
ncbi:SCO family protein [Paenibacillus sp. J2TS4]|uniref:SCO family protein n=1 Tax=Paenibacillus sp. J2TS4 TaxID=2807194 RepID=UPI001B077D75|nr:SCO family protein [Paenibacillus sp. J2TS4]GIP31149.1 SCO family protein [Paenibacillus sp. J2TS4]